MEPEKPLPSDCCGSGCTPCVFDIYEQQLQYWREKHTGDNFHERTDLRTDLLSKTRFKPFRLVQKFRETDDVFSFSFCAVEYPSEEWSTSEKVSGILPYKIGQHLVLRCGVETYNDINGEREYMTVTDQEESGFSERKPIITRAYTPITIATQESHCCFKIFAKLYEQGVMSVYLKNSSVGDILYWRGPYGNFSYTLNSFRYILMLCIGTGLAPMVPIVTSIVNDHCDDTQVHLMYGVRNIEHVILRDSLRALTQYWNFTLEFYCSENVEANRSVKFGEKVVQKRIDAVSVGEYIAGKGHGLVQVLICGTDSFTSEMKNNLVAIGMDMDRNVHVF